MGALVWCMYYISMKLLQWKQKWWLRDLCLTMTPMFSNMNKHQHHLENVFRHRWLDTFIASESIVLGVCIPTFWGDPEALVWGLIFETTVWIQPTFEAKKALATKKALPPTYHYTAQDLHRLMPKRIKELARYQTPAKSNNTMGGNKTQLALHWNIATHWGEG